MIIETGYGKVAGIKEGGMIAFKGIPFAKAPVGELRFKAPVPVSPWEGILPADKFGNRSMQTDEQEYDDDIPFSEDCLNLNIWIPEKEGTKRPVVFYIHGGGHCSGANSDKCFDGPHLIGDKEAIMVAPNYRLGALGYLYLKDYLGDEYADSGNCGLLDQLLALKWVHENIEAFGGDKDNVILMGQSAGGKSVANLMVTPGARGLFKKAIMQSGATQCIRDTVTATRLTKIMLDELGISKANARDIIGIEPEKIIEAQKRAYKKINFGHMFGPVLDGKTITMSPEEYILGGNLDDIKVMIGYNRKELYFSDPKKPISREEAKEKFDMCYGLNSKYALEKYDEFCKSESDVEAFDHVQTEFIYGNGTLRLTQILAESGIKTWSYFWDFEGNCIPYHFTEMPYIFRYSEDEMPKKGYAQKDSLYSTLMNETWMAFIMNGNPENTLLPNWPPCESSEMGYRMYFEEKPSVRQFDLRSYFIKMPMQVIRLR